MLLDDNVVGHREAEARPFPGWLRGEKGIEHLLLYFRRNADAVVANTDLYRLAEVPRECAEDWLKAFISRLDLAPVRGIEAVGDQVEQRPSDLLRIQFDRPRVGIEVSPQRDCKAGLLRSSTMICEIEAVLDDGVHFGGSVLAGALA